MVVAVVRLQNSSFVVAFRSSLSQRRRPILVLPTVVSYYSESMRGCGKRIHNRLAMLPTVTSSMSSASSSQAATTYTVLFDLLVPEGRCVGLSIADLPDHHPDALHVENVNGRSDNGHWIHQCLHPDEVNYGVSVIQSPTHRKSFWLGRLAMRYALSVDPTTLQLPPQPRWGTSDNANNPSILKDAYGRPQVPRGFLGSISHKGTTGVALVAANVPSGAQSLVPRSGVGVDLEYAIHADRRNIARKVLTLNEQANLGRIPVSTVYP
jgi:4'-phosphopantetheinyl transferase N-terminal domain